MNLHLDTSDREMLRALCQEFSCTKAHVFRQLLREAFARQFPRGVKVAVSPRPNDQDRGPNLRGPRHASDAA